MLPQHSPAESQEAKLFEKRSGAQFSISTIRPPMFLRILQFAE